MSDVKKGYEDEISKINATFKERIRHEVRNFKENFEKHRQEVADEVFTSTSGQINEILAELQHNLTSMWWNADAQLEATKKLCI